MAENLTMSPEMVLETIAAKCKADGDDLHLRVQRKRNGQMPEVVARLEQARMEHIVSPENWLPALCGGGPTFMILVYHASNSNTPVGTVIINVEGPSKAVDPTITRRQDWSGPRVITYPKLDESRNDPSYSVPLPSVGATPRIVAPEGKGGEAFSPHNPRADQLEATYLQRLAELDRFKNEFMDKSRNLEVEAARREGDLRAREAEARAAERRPQPQGESLGSVLRELLPVMLPIVGQILESGRQLQIETAKAQALATVEAAKATAAASAENAKAQQALLASIAARPAIDPQVLALITKDDGSARMMEHMGDLIASTTSTTMNVLNAAVEMSMGGRQEQQEPVALRAVREGVKALVALSGATRKTAQQAQAPAQPPKQLPTKPQPKPAQAAPAPVKPSPAPDPTPAPEPEEQLRAAEPTQLDIIISHIREKVGEPKAIAEELLNSISDPSVIEVFSDENLDLNALFEERLGSWLEDEDNAEYLRQVIREFASQGVASGLFSNEIMQDIEEVAAGIGQKSDEA